MRVRFLMNNNYLSIAALAAVFVCSTANAQLTFNGTQVVGKVVNTPIQVSGKVTAVSRTYELVTLNGISWKFPPPLLNRVGSQLYRINGMLQNGPILVGDTCSWTGIKTDTPANANLMRPGPATVTYSVPMNNDSTSSIVCTR